MQAVTIADPPRRRLVIAAETVATLAIALWLGGMLALGALAAPTVFGKLDREAAGAVMGTIFGKFDRMVVGLVVAFALGEGVRAALDGVGGWLGRLRLGLAAVMAGAALVSALWIGPEINALFEAGVRRGAGDAGARMDALHGAAETLGKVAFTCAAAWIALGVAHRRAPAGPPATPRDTGAGAGDAP